MTHRFSSGILVSFAAIYIIWGSTYLAIRIATATMPPLTMIGVRCLMAGAILYGWARWRRAESPTGVQWGYGLLVGAALFLGGQGGLAWAQQRVPSGVASLFMATIPLWMVLLQVATADGAKVTLRTFGGVAAGLIGILVLAGPNTVFSGEPVDLLGAIVLILSALSWAIGSELSRRTPRPSSRLMANGTYLMGGGLLLFVVGAAIGEVGTLRASTISASSLFALGYLIVFGSAIAFVAYSWLLDKTSLATVSTYAFANPIIAVFLGWAFGGEIVDSRVLSAAALVVAAVVLILSERRTVHLPSPRSETAVSSSVDCPLTTRMTAVG